jgi:glycosyltransferase involved in cell wall biosynthesis
MIKASNREQYEPVLLFYGPNPYREQFEALGVTTLVLSEQGVSGVSGREREGNVAARLNRLDHRAASTYISVKSLYTLVRFDLPVARAIRQIILDRQIDLVHLNDGLHKNRAAVLAARWTGRPCVCHVRTLEQFLLADRLLAGLVRWFIYISRAVADTVTTQGIDSRRGAIISDSVDLSLFTGVRDEPAVRAELGLEPDDIVIGNFSRLDWWKGQDVFLEAMAEVVKTAPGVKALIVGDATSSARNRAYWERLTTLTEALGLRDRVIFTGYRSDVPRLLGICDVAVHSATRPEPFGLVVIEAMAAGVPLVATGAGGVLDIVRDGANGLLVPPGDPSAMAGAILSLVTDRGLACRLAEAGQRRVREQYTAEQHAAAVQDVYNAVFCDLERTSRYVPSRVQG